MYDCIIVGAGPAGIEAAIYIKRANLNPLVLYYGESELEKASKIENYYGFEDGISGKELFDNGIKQAENIGIEVRQEEIIDIKMNEDLSFTVKSIVNDISKNRNQEDKIVNNQENGNETGKENVGKCENVSREVDYNSKSIIIATGTKRLKLNIKGINKFDKHGVSYCAVCDGFFYKNKNVAVIGNGEYALSEAKELKNIAKSVTILTNGRILNGELKTTAKENFDVIEKEIKEIAGKNTSEQDQVNTEPNSISQTKLEFVIFNDDTKIYIDGIFIAEGTAGGGDFAKKMGIITNEDEIKVNSKMQTNIPGVFACGNITGGLKQVSKSVYEGTVAGLEVVNFIRTTKTY